MTTSDSESPNPYQTPTAPEPSATPASALATPAAYKLLKDFRTQIHALGGFWVFLGCVAVGIAVFLGATVGFDEEMGIVFGILAMSALIWMALGVLTCYKQIWAVWVGLVLSYLSLIGNLLTFNICSLIILLVVIVQAHRVLGWAKQLTRMGIPLTALPHSLPTPQNQRIDFSKWE